MGLQVLFHGSEDGDDGPFSLASAAGWTAFGAWADTLGDKFAPVKEFAINGEFAGTDDLAAALARAIDMTPPDDTNVLTTAQELIGNMGVGSSDETASVVTDDDTPDDTEPLAKPDAQRIREAVERIKERLK